MTSKSAQSSWSISLGCRSQLTPAQCWHYPRPPSRPPAPPTPIKISSTSTCRTPKDWRLAATINSRSSVSASSATPSSSTSWGSWGTPAPAMWSKQQQGSWSHQWRNLVPFTLTKSSTPRITPSSAAASGSSSKSPGSSTQIKYSPSSWAKI